MATLVHEVWVSLDEDGKKLHSCILAGRRGMEARAMMEEEHARFLYCFEAESHLDAMVKYHRKVHGEIYTNPEPHAWDNHPYPQAWADQQQADGILES